MGDTLVQKKRPQLGPRKKRGQACTNPSKRRQMRTHTKSKNYILFYAPFLRLRWPDSRESIRRFAELNPFFANRVSALKNCKSQVWGDSRECLERYENRFFFLQIDSRELALFALRITGPSRFAAGIIERGVPQAYVRARASSETLRSVHVSRVFLCIFYIKWEIDTYQNGLGYKSDTYPNPYPPVTVPPLWLFSFCGSPKIPQRRQKLSETRKP